MNRPRFNSPKSSPGFVYFQTAAPNSNPADTTDFLAFNETKASPQSNKVKSFQSSPLRHTFNPNCTSSPVHFKRGNNSRNNWNVNRSSKQQYNRRSSNYDSTSSNRSFQNDSWNSSASTCSPRQQNRKRNSDGEIKKDISNYIHPSFFEDPWANLVKNVERSWAEADAQNEVKSEGGTVESVAEKSVDVSQNENEVKNSGTSSEDSSEDGSGNDSDSSSENDT